MKKHILFLLLLLATTCAAQSRKNRLFQFERSTNDHIVCYDAKLDGNKLHAKKPIDVYWSMLSDSTDRSELNFFERTAVFGCNIVSKKENEVAFTLKASGRKVLHMCKIKGSWRAVTTISGRKAYVTRFYAKMKSAIKVEYLDIFGKDLETGADVKERMRE